ncbi:pirin family protein [Paenibacillus sp. FJAT-26967]|uniref:pirin family protein n=1 Tax=Paenibacillus sp. FJAT-26967 TaxID=1729690 RepID=UPI00083885D2|nr:pirin family protein [Paenibacillus sp. FJAT-26967]
MNIQSGKRNIAEVKTIKLEQISHVHTAGPVMEPGYWSKFDPFLLMMEDKFRKGAFDVHPHRGIETVTYVIDGQLEHYDSSTGDGGVLMPGDVQWMTAGSGVVHNEVPSEGITAHTLQLWVNLPREQKMSAPRYQNMKSSEMPVREEEGVLIRVFSGSSGGVTSPTLNHVPVTMVEMLIEPGKTVSQDLPGSYKGLIYILEGRGMFGANQVEGSKGQALFFGEDTEGEETEMELTAKEALRLLLYAGQPLREPVVARGPFVMNTEEEIYQAYSEYRSGTFLK